MNTQTSLVAEQIRLQQWANQIHDCQTRPIGMKIETWCAQNSITKANYYYRLRRVREACLDQAQDNEPRFVELPVPTNSGTAKPCPVENQKATDTVAILHGPNKISIEILSNASAEFIRTLIGALSYAQ